MSALRCPVRFGILGPLVAARNGHELDLGRPKQRAVLVALLIDCDGVVSLDRLVDQVWGEEGTAQHVVSLRAYVSNLRRAFDPERGARSPCPVLVTESSGYRLRAAPETLDAACFESLAGRGRRLLDDGRPGDATEILTEALGLWRGPALADFAYEQFAQAEAARLEELRAATIESRLEAELQLGRRVAATAELEGLVIERPLRERLWEMLMVALYQSGRQGDALRAFSAARTVLGEELGIDPGPSLRRLETDILAQSPLLEWHPPAGRQRPEAGAGSSPDNRRPPASWVVGRDGQVATPHCRLGRRRCHNEDTRRWFRVSPASVRSVWTRN